MIVLDMYYENREPDFSRDDTFGPVFFSDTRSVYWFNILDTAGKYIGDVTCPGSIELAKWVKQHGGEIAWKA